MKTSTFFIGRSRLPSLIVLLAALPSPGCLAEEGLSVPDDAVIGPGEVAVVRLENPVVRGGAYMRTTAVMPRSGAYTEVRTMSPDGAFLVVDTPNVMRDGGWLSNGLPPGVGSIGAPAFDAPSVSLPMGGAPVEFTLFTRHGRIRTESVPPGTIPPPLGFDDEEIESISIALDPNVLVVPVRVHAFVGPQGETPYWFPGRPPLSSDTMRQFLDPGAVATIAQATIDDGFESRNVTESGLLVRSIFEPDGIWTQCDIQFHLESFEIIVQQNNLEDTLREDCLCGFNGPPLGPFLEAFDDAVPVYIGGRIAPDGGTGCAVLGDIFALTCAAPAPCLTTVGETNFDGIIIDGRFFPQALPHELGHFLGLGHTDTGGTCAPDAVGTSGNLMGSFNSTGILTPDQCAYARCITARRLAAWGRLPSTEADALCAAL